MQIATTSQMEMPAGIRLALNRTASMLKSFKPSDFHNRKLFAPSTHLLRHPGKLIRPTLVFIGASALGEEPVDFIDIAIAAELLHTSSLVHDDIIDRDSVRRGISAVHVKYGQEAAILAGDALISKAIALSARYGERVLNALSGYAMGMCAGEMLDYGYQKSKLIPGPDAYLKIATLKSASVMGMCASIVALYKKDRLVKNLEGFGTNFGIAFQIRDDVIDFMHLDKGNGAGELANFRPNIVSTLMKNDGITRSGALLRSISLNNYYLNKANSMLNGSKSTKLFKDYSEFVRLRPN